MLTDGRSAVSSDMAFSISKFSIDPVLHTTGTFSVPGQSIGFYSSNSIECFLFIMQIYNGKPLMTLAERII